MSEYVHITGEDLKVPKEAAQAYLDTNSDDGVLDDATKVDIVGAVARTGQVLAHARQD